MAKARFIFPKQYAMRLNDTGKLKTTLAFFTVIDTLTGIEYRDVQLKTGKNGVYVSSPYRSYEDKKTKETKYINYWRAAYDEGEGAFSEEGMATLDQMTEAAHKLYLSMAGGEGEAAPRKGRSSSKAKPQSTGRRSARGPAPEVEESGDDDFWGF